MSGFARDLGFIDKLTMLGGDRAGLTDTFWHLLHGHDHDGDLVVVANVEILTGSIRNHLLLLRGLQILMLLTVHVSACSFMAEQ